MTDGLQKDIFKCIYVNENGKILFQITLKSVSKGPINNISDNAPNQ